MEDLGTLNAVFAVIVLVVGTIAALLLGTLKTLRDSNNDLRARVSDLESVNDVLVGQVGVLTADRDALGRMVRGDEHLDRITTKLDGHHNEAKVHWARDEDLLAAGTAATATLIARIEALISRLSTGGEIQG